MRNVKDSAAYKRHANSDSACRSFSMNTDQTFIDETVDHLLKHRVRFAHSPLMWSECELPIELDWQSIKFGQEQRQHVPSDQFGVYAFMLQPNISGPPKSAYLMYIGMTCRSFSERYGEYLDKELKRFGRTLIGRMLGRWDGHLWFHYASVQNESLIGSIEETLLNACIPPYNQKFTGRVGAAITAFKAETASGG